MFTRDIKPLLFLFYLVNFNHAIVSQCSLFQRWCLYFLHHIVFYLIHILHHCCFFTWNYFLTYHLYFLWKGFYLEGIWIYFVLLWSHYLLQFVFICLYKIIKRWTFQFQSFSPLLCLRIKVQYMRNPFILFHCPVYKPEHYRQVWTYTIIVAPTQPQM